jgi:hypothetical protein
VVAAGLRFPVEEGRHGEEAELRRNREAGETNADRQRGEQRRQTITSTGAGWLRKAVGLAVRP